MPMQFHFVNTRNKSLVRVFRSLLMASRVRLIKTVDSSQLIRSIHRRADGEVKVDDRMDASATPHAKSLLVHFLSFDQSLPADLRGLADSDALSCDHL